MKANALPASVVGLRGRGTLTGVVAALVVLVQFLLVRAEFEELGHRPV